MANEMSDTARPQAIRFEGAPPDTLHVSLGSAFRTIAWVVCTIALVMVAVRLYGWGHVRDLEGIVTIAVGLVIVSIFVPGIRVASQWEKGVVLRLGRYAGTRGPGIFYVLPGLETVSFVDTRLLTLEIPAQHSITKDNVPVQIDGAIFFQVIEPGLAIVAVQDYRYATSQYAQAALRDVVGGLLLDELLGEREQIQERVRNMLEQRLSTIGVHVDSVRILDVDVPEDLKRMMSRQASAEREKRATITKAEGDKLAALNLSEAAATMLNSPGAMQLRTLQSIDGLGGSPSNTIVLFPLEMLEFIRGGLGKNVLALKHEEKKTIPSKDN